MERGRGGGGKVPTHRAKRFRSGVPRCARGLKASSRCTWNIKNRIHWRAHSSPSMLSIAFTLPSSFNQLYTPRHRPPQSRSIRQSNQSSNQAINSSNQFKQSTATRLILNHRPVRPEISPQAKRIQDDRSGAARRRADGSTGQAGQAIINSIDASDQSSFQLNQCSQFKQSSNLQPRAQSTAINQSSRVLKYPGRKSAQVACSLARLSIRLILEARLQANPERCRATKPTINSS